jgi:glycosyltransferase involved in cell wall biosynthesis
MEYRVVLIKTPDPRGITESLINALNDVLQSKGFKTKVVEPTPENIQNVVNEIYEFNPLFMFDFNLDGVIYGEKDGKKVPLADIMGNLHMSWFFDDPMVHWIKLKPILNSTQMVYLTIDIEHSQWLGSLGKNVAFLSPGIVPRNIPSPRTEKEFDVAFIGPVVDPVLIENDWRQRFDEHLYIYAVELGRMLYRNPDMPIRFASGYLLSQFNQQFQEAMLNLQREKEDEFMTYLAEIGVYAMNLRRWNILENIDEVEINVIGKVEGEVKDNIVVYEDIYKEKDILQFLAKSKISLLSHPPFIPTSLGYTAFNSLACNTLTMTEERFFTKSFFKENEEIVLYNPTDYLDIVSKIAYYLENEDEREDIANAGRDKVFKEHTIENRGEFIANMMMDIVKQAEEGLKKQQNQSEGKPN